jgi:hypothetical protein
VKFDAVASASASERDARFTSPAASTVTPPAIGLDIRVHDRVDFAPNTPTKAARRRACAGLCLKRSPRYPSSANREDLRTSRGVVLHRTD